MCFLVLSKHEIAKKVRLLIYSIIPLQYLFDEKAKRMLLKCVQNSSCFKYLSGFYASEFGYILHG